MQDIETSRSSFRAFTASLGESTPCAANLPVYLDEPENVYAVANGGVNVFFIETKDGVDLAAPQFLMTRKPGDLLFGTGPVQLPDGSTLRLVAKGSTWCVTQAISILRFAKRPDTCRSCRSG